jgi:hypothetical protein
MGAMKDGTDSIQGKADPRAASLLSFGTQRQEQGFDIGQGMFARTGSEKRAPNVFRCLRIMPI